MTELAVGRHRSASASDRIAMEFRAVYRSELHRLVRLAHLITGSNAAAEDLVHDVFTAAFRRWDKIDDPKGYLYRAVVNRSRSHLRRHRLERSQATPQPGISLPPEVDETWASLVRLPVRRRAVLVLRYYEDLSVDQIAELMNVRPGTVRSLIHRGHESLRKVLEQ